MDAEVERKLRRVLSVVETTFDHLHLNKATEETVRKDAACVVEIAVKHARCCHGSECQIPLASKPSAVRSLRRAGVARKARAQAPEQPERRSERDARTEYRPRRQLRLQGSALNGTQRSVTTAAIGIALGWGFGMANLPCRCSSPAQPMGPPQPPPLALPAPAQIPLLQFASETLASPLLSPAPDLSGEAAALPVYPVRDRIEAAVRSARLSESLRRAALAAIQTPETISWMERENLPADVAAIAVLSATATKFKKGPPSTLTSLRATLCHQHSISTTTLEASEATLDKLLPAFSASFFGEESSDGIF